MIPEILETLRLIMGIGWLLGLTVVSLGALVVSLAVAFWPVTLVLILLGCCGCAHD